MRCGEGGREGCLQEASGLRFTAQQLIFRMVLIFYTVVCISDPTRHPYLLHVSTPKMNMLLYFTVPFSWQRRFAIHPTASSKECVLPS